MISHGLSSIIFKVHLKVSSHNFDTAYNCANTLLNLQKQTLNTYHLLRCSLTDYWQSFMPMDNSSIQSDAKQKPTNRKLPIILMYLMIHNNSYHTDNSAGSWPIVSRCRFIASRTSESVSNSTTASPDARPPLVSSMSMCSGSIGAKNCTHKHHRHFKDNHMIIHLAASHISDNTPSSMDGWMDG